MMRPYGRRTCMGRELLGCGLSGRRELLCGTVLVDSCGLCRRLFARVRAGNVCNVKPAVFKP